MNEFYPKLIVLLASLLLVPPLCAEVGTAVVFLVHPPGARANGMGQAFVAVADDGTAAHYNPAGLAMSDTGESCYLPWPIEGHFTHSPWMPVYKIDDLYLRYSSFIQHLPGIGTIGISGTDFHLGDIMETDAEGNELGTFEVFDSALSISYSVRITPRLSIGMTYKDIYSQSSPDGSARTSWATDWGLLYRFPDLRVSSAGLILKGPRIGLSRSNRGPDISYGYSCCGDPLPELLRVGIAQEIMFSRHARLLISAELNKIMVNEKEDSRLEELRESKRGIGSEFEMRLPLDEFLDIPKDRLAFSFAFRAGYYYDREAPNIPEGNTFGVGVGLDMRYRTESRPLRLKFDYASVEPPENIGNTHTKMYSFGISL